jgi:hypothetical protein
MGTFTQSRGRDRLDIIRQLLDYETDAYAQSVIDHATVGTTVHLLVRRTPKDEWQTSSTYVNDADGSFRWIAVFLTRKARDAYDFGYKDMEVPGGFRAVALQVKSLFSKQQLFLLKGGLGRCE